VDGQARLWPAPAGIVVFERGYAEIWKLLRDDGLPTASLAASPPASVVGRSTEAGLHLTALSYGPPGSAPALLRTQTLVTTDSLAALCSEPLCATPMTVPPSARLVRWDRRGDDGERGDSVLVDLAAGRPVLRPVAEESAGAPLPVTMGGRFGRIEQALALPPTGRQSRRRLALLLSDPTALAVIATDAGATAATGATLELPGAPRPTDRFFSRSALVLSPERLLVATDAGVWAIRTWTEGDTIRLRLDHRFAGATLRGPLAGPIQRRRRNPLPPRQADDRDGLSD
jgi:hypothetical protein